MTNLITGERGTDITFTMTTGQCAVINNYQSEQNLATCKPKHTIRVAITQYNSDKTGHR